MKLTIVIPTYNEAENLPKLAAALLALPVEGLSLFVVDDNSPDGTGEIADRLAADHPERVAVMHRAGKLGLGTAYIQGFQQAMQAGAELLCQMDADLSHDPSDLPRLVGALDRGADVVLGSRYVPGGRTAGWSRFRRLVSAGGNRFVRRALGVSIADATSGFRAYRATTLDVLNPGSCQASGYVFQVEMAWRARQLAGGSLAALNRAALLTGTLTARLISDPAMVYGSASGAGPQVVYSIMTVIGGSILLIAISPLLALVVLLLLPVALLERGGQYARMALLQLSDA